VTPCQDLEAGPLPPLPVPQEMEGGKSQGEKDERSDSLLYLNSNNADRNYISKTLFSPYHKKQAEVILRNTERYITQIGLEKTGFLTLTFPDNVKCHKEAYRRFGNMRRRFLCRLFGPEWLAVKELQVRGAWHFHILVNCLQDIRTGINWQEIHPSSGKRPKYKSASPYLRSLWKELREGLPKYNFGRSELLPIKSTAEGCAKYMGKYLSKHNWSKVILDEKNKYKGVRLFSSSQGFVTSTPKFSWNTEGGKEWRRKLEKFCDLSGLKDLEQMQLIFGQRWANNLKDYIVQVDTLTPPEIKRISKIFKTHFTKNQDLENLKHNKKLREDPEMANQDLINIHTGEVIF